MGFLTVGRRFLNDQNEIIDDRIDLVGRGLLGLTIGCARCHAPQVRSDPQRRLLLALRRLRQLRRARRASPARSARREARPRGGVAQGRARQGPKAARRLPGGPPDRDREGPAPAILRLSQGGLRPGAQSPAPEAGRACRRRQAGCPAAPDRDHPLEAKARIGRRPARSDPWPAAGLHRASQGKLRRQGRRAGPKPLRERNRAKAVLLIP